MVTKTTARKRLPPKRKFDLANHEAELDSYAYAVYQDHNRHSCIVVHLAEHDVYFIPMEATQVNVVRMGARMFHSEYTPVPDYPVRRAAEIYLYAPGKEVAPKAREHLERIMADPAFVYDSSLFNRPPIQVRKETDIMATAKKTPAAKKAAPEAAAETKPTKQKAAAKTAAAPAEKAGKGRPRDDDATYQVVDDSSVKRGYIAEFVAAAKKLNTFTRDKLLAKLAGGEADDQKLLRYFYYCTGKGIFAAVEK